jgi:L-fuculose-phosphate aldolase
MIPLRRSFQKPLLTYQLTPLVGKHTINSTSVTQDKAIKAAGINANMLVHPEYSNRQLLALSARILADNGHGGTLSGQISCRDTGGDGDGDVAMWTGVYGKSFDEMATKDFIRIDSQLQVVSGKGTPNLATRFHLHVYRNRPDVQCIVHTHPIHTSALSQLGVPLFINHMDHMALYNDVQFLRNWPGVPFGDEEGEIITSVLAPNHNAALLAHHGLIVTGRNIEEATYRAYFFERAAHIQLKTMAANGGSMDNLPQVDRKLAETARDWRISEGPVKAHYYAWARQTTTKHGPEFLAS